jgi:hypothetical protein
LLSKLSWLALSASLLFATTAIAQTTPKACPAPPAVLKSTQTNIFSEQQEQWLGDAMADMLESDYKPVNDPAENEYLAHIAKRLLAVLPPTTIQFRVILVDSSDVNGFSLAGGRVYLTRKLVANAQNEDEVASVIGHEMGHILSHQFAIETTAGFKRLLNVTSVGDKADIYAKFQQLVDARMKDKHHGSSSEGDEKEYEADAVSVYATAAAGYRPQAEAEFWVRMFFVDGKVGGRLSDFFHVTKPDSKRLRSILKLIDALPPGCGAAQPTTSPEFEHWHALIVANQAVAVEASAKPAAEVTLSPPLRMDLERLHFSYDGKYILAQDESTIFVLSRDPYKLLFRFNAERALPAEFSPDSQHIVFATPGLHTEEWSIADQKLVASHEPLTRRTCIQSKLSPDGRTLFCVSFNEAASQVDLAMLDVETGQVVFQKKGFFRPNLNFLLALEANRSSPGRSDILVSSFSADGNTLLIGPGVDKLAFDLRTRSPIPIGGGLKSEINDVYAFLGNDRIVGVNHFATKDAGIFSFPEGQLLRKVSMAVWDMEPVSNGDYVITHTISDYAVGLVDISVPQFVLESDAPSMDVWNGWSLTENADGSILLLKLHDDSAPSRSATLPQSSLGPATFALASADGRYLALSSRTRGGVWDLATGQRMLVIRHFNSAVFAPDDTFYAEFPKFNKQDRGIFHITLKPFNAAHVAYKEEEFTYLEAGMLQEWKWADKQKVKVDLIVHDVRDNSILWRHTFDERVPTYQSNTGGGQMLISSSLKRDFAKIRLKSDPSLAAEAAAIKNKDAGRLIQVFDDATSNILREFVLEVPLTYEDLSGISIVGDLLYLTSEDNRTMVYALSTRAQLRQMFGFLIAADPASGRICLVNRRDEALVYDAQGKQLADFYMGSPLRFAAFQPNTPTPGSHIILLTADQKVRTMEVPNSPPADQTSASN